VFYLYSAFPYSPIAEQAVIFLRLNFLVLGPQVWALRVAVFADIRRNLADFTRLNGPHKISADHRGPLLGTALARSIAVFRLRRIKGHTEAGPAAEQLMLHLRSGHIRVTVEVSNASGFVVWSKRFGASDHEFGGWRDRIADAVLTAIHLKHCVPGRTLGFTG
jgi:hypothetical protein